MAGKNRNVGSRSGGATGKGRLHGKRRASRRSKPALQNAFRQGAPASVLDTMSADDLAEMAHTIGSFLHWKLGDPTKDEVERLKEQIPQLDAILNLDIVMNRFASLDDFERNTFGISIRAFFPELSTLYDSALRRFEGSPNGVSKAESWLRPIARDAGADSDVEAAVYFASRGRKTLVDVGQLRQSWHAAICFDVERGRPFGGRVPTSALERARSKTLSLAEAADVLESNGELPRFFGFRDEEEDFIDAAFVRAVEWLNISGFDRWVESYTSPLSVGPQYGIDHLEGAFWLFHWCRSDLALTTSRRGGLEAWLWALVNGMHEREKPWRLPDSRGKQQRLRDFLLPAGIIVFASQRINPKNKNDAVLRGAADLLLTTQLACGAWPSFSDESTPSLLSTCTAIHGLALLKPRGWAHVAKQAAKWLKKEQTASGYWHVEGGPTVMLTVLALDSLSLAEDSTDLTFRLTQQGSETATPRTRVRVREEPHYDYSKEEWYNPEPPSYKSVSVAEARKIERCPLALIVATETELLQVLRVLRPLPGQKKVLKITNDLDTYYRGRFGSFSCVLNMATMGSEGPSGSALSSLSLIELWNPVAVVLLGIAFGATRDSQHVADVLIAESVIPYESQRVGKTKTIYRNPVPPSSSCLVNRFRNALNWVFKRPDGSICVKRFGPLFSGQKLVDNLAFKNTLLAQYPNAIGGEMEGAGLWSAASRARKEWIVVKAVCDWGDGRKHKEYQPMAAASATSLCLHVFSDRHALDGIPTAYA